MRRSMRSHNSEEASTSEGLPFRFAQALWAILALALGLRLFRLGEHSIWLDEAHTWWITAMPLRDMWAYINVYELHPHLHYLIVRSCVLLFGDTELVMRLPSALAGTLEVYAVFLLGRELSGRTAGLLGGLLVALSNSEILFSQEARMYSFLMLFLVLSAYHFMVALRTNAARSWAFFGLFTILAAWTDYRAFFIALALHGYLCTAPGMLRERWRGLLLADLVTALAVLPLVPVAAHQVGPGGAGASLGLYFPDLSPALMARTLWSYLGGFILPVGGGWIWSGALVLLALLVAGAGFQYRDQGRIALVNPLILGVSFGILVPFSLFKSQYYDVRSMMFLSPFVLLGVAQAVLELGRRWKPAGALILLGVLVLNVAAGNLWYFDPNYSKQNVRDVVGLLSAQMQEGDLVVVVPDYQQYPFRFYWRSSGSILFLKPPDLENPQVQGRLAAATRVWWVFAGDKVIDPAGMVRNHVTRNYRVEQAVEAPNMAFHPINGPSIQIYLARALPSR